MFAYCTVPGDPSSATSVCVCSCVTICVCWRVITEDVYSVECGVIDLKWEGIWFPSIWSLQCCIARRWTLIYTLQYWRGEKCLALDLMVHMCTHTHIHTQITERDGLSCTMFRSSVVLLVQWSPRQLTSPLSHCCRNLRGEDTHNLCMHTHMHIHIDIFHPLHLSFKCLSPVA